MIRPLIEACHIPRSRFPATLSMKGTVTFRQQKLSAILHSPCWQFVPVYPGRQTHRYPESVTSHLPLFWHGFIAHSSSAAIEPGFILIFGNKIPYFFQSLKLFSIPIISFSGQLLHYNLIICWTNCFSDD